MTDKTMKAQSADAQKAIAIEYFYKEKIDAMKKAGFSAEEIANSSYVKHLKDFLAMDSDIVAKYQAETKNKDTQKKARTARVAHEKEVYAMDHEPRTSQAIPEPQNDTTNTHGRHNVERGENIPDRYSVERAVEYFVKEHKDAMKEAGYTDKEIAASSYVKNLPTFLKMDPQLTAKYEAEINAPSIQKEERAKRIAHEKAVHAAQTSSLTASLQK